MLQANKKNPLKHNKKGNKESSLVAQWVKDLALSLLSLWLLLRHGSIPDLGISACYGCDQKKKKKKRERENKEDRW